MQSISDGCLRALSRRRPFPNRLTLPMLDHFKAQAKIGSQIRRIARADFSCFVSIIQIKKGLNIISVSESKFSFPAV
jgi:hypothetical protein